MSLSYLATTPISSPTTTISGNPLPRSGTTNTCRSIRLSNRTPYTSCQLNQENQEPTRNGSIYIDRRNLLLGFGGLYGSTAVTKNAFGKPLQPFDASTCHDAIDGETGETVKCCPSYKTANMVDFTPPSPRERLRIRKPAHKYNSDDIAKFEAAIAKMKALPDNHPWSFKQQAAIHCTYCNGAFDQVNSKTKLEVHKSWYFLPWHRYYIYFWERILGELIGDDTFAIPFWNWDTHEGMFLPKMYQKNTSPLYDEARNKDHYNKLMDYGCPMDEEDCYRKKTEDLVTYNLAAIFNTFQDDNLKIPSLFMGNETRAGEKPAGGGSLEYLHNAIHLWVGQPNSPYHDMGNFVTAARHPVFFAHHGNVDRLWDIYSKLRKWSGETGKFKYESDLMDSSFVFYDENHQVVKVKVKDCLTPESLRYSYNYDSAEIHEWAGIRRKYRKLKNAEQKRSAGDSLKLNPASEFGSKPRNLTEPIRALVQRPPASGAKDEKEDSVEVLFIEDIIVPHGSPARFDVYVAKPTSEGLVGTGEFAGRFVNVPHSHRESSNGARGSSLELGISNLLKDIDAETSEELVVSLIPRNGEVTVGGVQIQLVDVNNDDDV
ncbi:hypothetical protein MKX03_020358 [Papaver bracteatum]|nr:hypothetical protein MKX03_020358 [Papaver bracteatum]